MATMAVPQQLAEQQPLEGRAVVCGSFGALIFDGVAGFVLLRSSGMLAEKSGEKK